MDPETLQLLTTLWHGGKWGSYFTLPKKKTVWQPADKPGKIPEDIHQYFGVHPVNEKKPGRSTVESIAAINCVFADFDAKDFESKGAALAHALRFHPLVIVDSGGGWHCYWRLADTFLISTDQDRERARRLQAAWVNYVGADPGSKDLAHILRIPGTTNRKYTPALPVSIYQANFFSHGYTLDDLEAMLPAPAVHESHNSNGAGSPDIERAREALSRLAAWRCADFAAWRDVGFSLQELGPSGLDLWDDWSRNCPEKYKAGDCAERWPTFDGQGIGLGSLYFWADQDNPITMGHPRPKSEVKTVEYDPPMPEPPDDFLPPVSESIVSPATDAQPVNGPAGPAPGRWTVAELRDTEFQDPNWAVPGIIPEGLTIFGGRPKRGKSWFMLQVSWAVGTGGSFFNHPVEKGEVLYLALEDSPRRLKNRIETLGIPREALITFVQDWRPFHQGGLDDFVIELERKQYRLIVIDTLTRAFPGVDFKNNQGPVNAALDQLQKIGQRRGLAIVIIDHTRKPSGMAFDPIDDIINQTQKTATADAILAIYKEQGKSGAFLRGRGRDFDDIDLKLIWDKTTCWSCEGESGAIIVNEKKQEILQALEYLGKSKLATIAKELKQNRGNTYTRLEKLVEAGLVKKEKIDHDIYYEKA